MANEYTPPPGSAVALDFAGSYTPAPGNSVAFEFLPDTEDKAQYLYPDPIYRRAWGTPTIYLGQRWYALNGIPSTLAFGTARLANQSSPQTVYPAWAYRKKFGRHRIFDKDVYYPQLGDTVFLDFKDVYTPPTGDGANLDFEPTYKREEGYAVYILQRGWNSSQFSTPHIELLTRYLQPQGIKDDQYGVSLVWNWNNKAWPPGFDSQAFGTSNIRNTAWQIRVNGLVATTYGGPTAWNWLQYRNMQGFNAALYGQAFVQGGVKYVTPGGIIPRAAGVPNLVNTTANQTARPQGIAAPAMSMPNVSPRTVFPFGILGSAFGTSIVQRNPAPKGFDASLYGTPFIEFKTKYLMPAGIDAGAFGYPRAFDPTRKLFVSSVVQAGVFGDTRIANRSFVVRVPGSDYLEIPAWHYVENNRRHLAAPGWNSAAYGTLLIANKSPSISPPGIDSLRIGSVAVGYSVRYITPAGINSMRLGAPSLTKTPEIAPKGFAGAMGIPTVWRRVRILEAKGHDSQRFGQLSIWFRYRFVSPSGDAMARYGAGKVEHGRRTLLASGMQHAAYGTASVSNADRTIAPKSIFENFATGHMVGGLRFLRPVGYEATRFGSRIIPEIQQVFPLGFAGQYGLATIFNFRKVITPAGITTGVQPADRWGTARAWNLRQYVFMSYDPDSALNPPAWPQWTKIENRTRVIRTSGRESLRIGDQQIDNKARPLYAHGIAAPSTPESYRAGMVAFRVRPFRLEGIEPPYLSTWASVRNTAAVLKPGGSVATLWGVPAVVNTRRTIDRIGGFDSAWYGYPMVAPRVRTLSFEGRYTIGAPLIPLPTVKLHTRYVDGIGYDASGVGWASLSIHWTLITPRWTLQNQYGIPAVRNVTPELLTRGRASDEYGDALVRLQWRPVVPDGTLTQLFGRAIITDRDRVMPVTGFRAGAMGDKHVVIRTGAPPYSMQTINLDAELFNGSVVKPGQGIPVPLNIAGDQVARPIINQQVIYVDQIDPMTRFGSAMVKANSIRVEPGYFDLLMGEPFVSLRVRRLHVSEYPDEDVPQPERPRLSPHTIYAVMDAPQQAKQNHQQQDLPLHYVDGFGRQPGVIFGWPDVSLRHRAIYPGSQPWQWIQPGYGNATLQLMRHYVRPTGFSSYRAGWHTIPGPQTAEQFNSVLASAYGFPTIWHYVPPGPRTIRPSGVLGTQLGASRIELFRRQLWPSGHYATLMGTRKPSDSPYMWQGLRVGPLMPTIPNGFQADLHGEPWVSFRVREIKPAGYDAFRCEYQLEAFGQRMRVYRAAVTRPARSIGPVGFSAFASAASAVRAGHHYIRPDGNADQYRKGAF